MGIAIWVVPSSEIASKLKRIMHIRPSDRNNLSESSYPNFEPHITLASLPTSTPLATVIKSIPVLQKSVEVDFKAVNKSDHFFRSVLLAIKSTPELWALHEHIHASLDIPPRTPMFPHMSICYISDKDAKNGEREAFAQELEKTGKVQKNGPDGVSLDCGSPGEKECLPGFVGTEVWIMDCDGPVEGWHLLHKTALT